MSRRGALSRFSRCKPRIRTRKGKAPSELLHRPGLGVTDAGLAHLQQLNKLELISLNNTQVTDAGLAYLKGLKGLKWLRIAGSRVTDAGVRELQKSLPQLRPIR